jgi:hypothetical protein
VTVTLEGTGIRDPVIITSGKDGCVSSGASGTFARLGVSSLVNGGSRQRMARAQMSAAGRQEPVALPPGSNESCRPSAACRQRPLLRFLIVRLNSEHLTFGRQLWESLDPAELSCDRKKCPRKRNEYERHDDRHRYHRTKELKHPRHRAQLGRVNNDHEDQF